MRTLVYGLGESGVAATEALLERGEDVDPGDVGDAVQNLRDIYAQLIDRPSN